MVGGHEATGIGDDGKSRAERETFGDAVSRWDQEGLDASEFPDARLWERAEATSVADAYDRFAPVYDEFNAQNDYEHWLGEVLLPELEGHGLRTGRVLDVGCGTGRAFPPLLDRGWMVTGCDVSVEMLRHVDMSPMTRRAGDRPRGPLPSVFEADARDLPVAIPGSPFDLILALNDVVNYLTEDGDLELFFEGVKRNLAPHGLVCFDANSLGLFEASWVAGATGPMSDRGWGWKGLTEDVHAGGLFTAEITGDGVDSHRHLQRHWTREQVEAAMVASGLRCLAVRGMTEDERGIVLEDPPDESRHYKTVYIGRHVE